MRGAIAIGCLLAGFASTARGQGALEPGDLLVTDLNNARVLRVRPGGQVEPFTPRESVTNLLENPSGIAIGFATGGVYAVDFADGDVVSIDPETGVQTRLSRFVFGFPPHSEPVNVGAEAWGIAVRQQGWTARFGEELYVAAPGAIQHVTRDLLGDWHRSLESDDPALPRQPRQISISEVPAEVYRMAIAAGAGGYIEYAFPGVIDESSLVPSRERVLGVHQLPSKRDTASVLFDVSNIFTCVNAIVVRPNGSGGSIWSQGGLLRCPVSVEIGLYGEVYVGDVESVVGGDPRILVLTPDGKGGFHQRILAELPDDGELPYPADIEVVRGRVEVRLFGQVPDGASATTPTGVSADGSVVVGRTNPAGSFVFRNGALEDLGDIEAEGLSADGTTVVGRLAGVPGRMRLDSAFEPFLEPSATTCVASEASADGDVAAGLCNEAPFTDVAARWAAPDAPLILGDLPGAARFSYLYGLSGDGAVACGTSATDVGWEAYRWTQALGMQRLEGPPGHTASEGTAISLDGETIVGAALGPEGWQAVRWGSSGPAIPIGDPPVEDFFASEAFGVSANGRVILGKTSGDVSFGPFLWDTLRGVRPLDLELADVYGVPDPGFGLGQVRLLSADGRAILGESNDSRAYRILFQAPEPGAAGLALVAAGTLAALARRR